MADHVDEVSINNAILSANTFGVKEEQCQEDSFVEDKVYISETAITIDNAVLQDPIWHYKIKQYEESTCSNNIKAEFASFEVTEVQNGTVKIEAGNSADDIKTELDNGLLYCEHCKAYYKDYCIDCGMLVHILNKYALDNADSGAREDIPNDILEIQDCFGHTGIYALRIIPAGVIFGPFSGLSPTEYPWETKGGKFVLDKNTSKYLNWMQFVNSTRNTCDRNLHVFQSEDNIYYQSTRQIQAGDELLLVYISEEYENSLNNIVRADVVSTMKEIDKEIFACTFCCLGFSCKSHLAKHKTVCVKDTAGKFSIEELTQCPVCKIYLDSKEYLEHHMAFCCERNARKRILPTPPPKEATIALNGRKRCIREIYKCEQCKYRTKNQADLKEHTNIQHYEVKMYKCGICNRRFKTKESFRLHMENTHAYIGEKDNQEHPTADYGYTHIKVEQSSSQDEKKVFKCVFRARHKEALRIHIKTKHLKKFDFKCDSCEFGTNNKTVLKRHIKTNHLKEFDYKCGSCEFLTNNKNNLEVHIKNKHLKKFEYKCDLCEYGTNCKRNLEVHIKNKHLRKFDFKCDSCEYGTNFKKNLEIHIKSKHLREFDFKCDSCEYGTNHKKNLEVHIKTKHLKQFDFKCDKCECRTNSKNHLEVHIKTKHSKEFDYKCDSCEFGTKYKNHLGVHMKTKHSKEFNYKCDSCEFGTNVKHHLEYHIKTKHLKKFDFDCDYCEFRTNIKTDLRKHIKTKHLKEFDYKCDSCEYRTNQKSSLERHMKRKHL